MELEVGFGVGIEFELEPGLMENNRLLFMTYNGWVMLSVAVGAFIGYLLFGIDTSSTKDGACH